VSRFEEGGGHDEEPIGSECGEEESVGGEEGGKLSENENLGEGEKPGENEEVGMGGGHALEGSGKLSMREIREGKLAQKRAKIHEKLYGRDGGVVVDTRSGLASLDSFAVCQAGGDMRSGGTESLSKDLVVEGFSISVAGKTLFDNADLRFSGIRQHTSAYVSIRQHMSAYGLFYQCSRQDALRRRGP
jgi:hypothetical protein